MRKTKIFITTITAAVAISKCGCVNVDGEVSSVPFDLANSCVHYFSRIIHTFFRPPVYG